MKKRLILGLAFTLMLGVGGCMDKDVVDTKQSVKGMTLLEDANKEQKELIDNMLNEVNERYDEDFKAYKFFPSSSGLNSHHSQSVVFAENSKDIKILISETNQYKGTFTDTYYNAVVSQSIKEEFTKYKNFEGDFSVAVLTYGAVDVNENEIKNNLNEIIDGVVSLRVSVYTEEDFNDEYLNKLYSFYSDIKKYNPDKIFFHAASNVDLKETKSYLEQEQYFKNFFSWYQFDTAIKEYLWIKETGEVSIDQFIKSIEKVGE